MKTEKDSIEKLNIEKETSSETISGDAEKRSFEQALSHLDFSANSPMRQQLYRRLERQVARPARHQPVYVTVISRLGAVAVLALVLGALLGMLRFQPDVSAAYTTALAAPHFNPAATPGTAVVGNAVVNVHPHPLPTPLAPPGSEAWPVLRTGTLLP